LCSLAVLLQSIRILREYERGVIFRLGKLQGAKGPGLIFLIPIVDRMVRMDLRVVTIDVPKQEIMTRDNVPATVDAVVYFRVVEPNAAVVKVENFWKATSLIAQTTLRSVLGQSPLDDLLSQRDIINQKLQEIIDKQNRAVGHQSYGGRGEGRGVAGQHETRDGQAGRSRTRTSRESGERGG
jgi:regulator of protease activity HflC (stomatin/prohibitin superfamily)